MSNFDTYIFDMDGVVYRGETATPHAFETFQWLRSIGKRIYFCTNNSSRSRTFFVDKISRLGIDAREEEIMTSAYCAAMWFRDRNIQSPVVLVVGEDGIPQELNAIGARVVHTTTGEAPVEFVVAGIDRGVTYDDLMHAHIAICRGAKFIATNCDSTYPIETGTIPGAGAIVAAIATSTGVKPLVLGKPEPFVIETILRESSTPGERALVVGDRLDTDIPSGKKAGAKTALVLTGISTREEAEHARPEQRPDYIIEDLSQLQLVSGDW